MTIDYNIYVPKLLPTGRQCLMKIHPDKLLRDYLIYKMSICQAKFSVYALDAHTVTTPDSQLLA